MEPDGLVSMLPDAARRRFLAKVSVVGDCWLWIASKTQGYGSFGGKFRGAAHLVAYRFTVGPVPVGKELDHLCRNRACVRPDHLEPVTHRENVLRGTGPAALEAKMTHCKNGHRLGGDNAAPGCRRQCQICKRAYRVAYYAKNIELIRAKDRARWLTKKRGRTR